MLHLSTLGVLLALVLSSTPAASSSQLQDSFECFESNEQLVRLQLYVGSEPGASWDLECESRGLVWDRSSDQAESWVFENYCVTAADTCQFSIQATGDTFYALVVDATTITVSSKEVESVDQSLCFGAKCDQLPLEMDDDDYYDSNNDSMGDSSRTKPTPSKQGVTAALIRQRSFILWLVATAITLVTVLVVWHCSITIRRLNALADVDDEASKDDDTVQDDTHVG